MNIQMPDEDKEDKESHVDEDYTIPSYNSLATVTASFEAQLLNVCDISVSRRKGEGVYDRNGAINIIFGIDIIAINSIDDTEQLVEGAFYCKWRYPCFEKKDDIWDAEKKEWKRKPWMLPMSEGWLVQNLTDSVHNTVKFFPEEEGVFQNEHVTWLAVTLRVDGSFKQKFSIQRFPFDKQKVVFRFGFWGNPYDENGKLLDGRLKITEDKKWNCRMQPGGFRCSDEWSLKNSKLKVNIGRTAPSPKFSRTFTFIECELKVKRKPGFIIWNCIIPTFIVVLLGLIGMLISRSFDFDRFAHIGTLVLTLFAIKFSISESLPNIGYPTACDTYLLTGVILLLVMGTELMITSYWEDERTCEETDIVVVSVLFTFWTVVTLMLRQISKLMPKLYEIVEDVRDIV